MEYGNYLLKVDGFIKTSVFLTKYIFMWAAIRKVWQRYFIVSQQTAVLTAQKHNRTNVEEHHRL